LSVLKKKYNTHYFPNITDKAVQCDIYYIKLRDRYQFVIRVTLRCIYRVITRSSFSLWTARTVYRGNSASVSQREYGIR